jgi:hypothetical protein
LCARSPIPKTTLAAIIAPPISRREQRICIAFGAPMLELQNHLAALRAIFANIYEPIRSNSDVR